MWLSNKGSQMESRIWLAKNGLVLQNFSTQLSGAAKQIP